MPLSLIYPDQSASQLTPNSTSSADGGNVVGFGFAARFVQVVNDRATAVYVNFNSTVASTGGYKTCSGEQISFQNIQCSGLSLAATATSTATFVRVLALGG